ncbi:MAG: hypothetical protein M4D80_05040 [Myxococcota bacterium]|nr:hypothetical protein [Myxococcota bacterium]
MKWFVGAFLVACGGSGSQNTGPSDGSSLDSSIDGSNPDAPALHACDPSTPDGPVTVWNSFPGAEVISHDVTGAFLGRASSGTGYDVQISVPGCGAVTVVEPGTAARLTFFAVQPGDTIWASGHPAQSVTYMDARIVIDQPLANVTTYEATASHFCRGYLAPGSNEMTMHYSSRCVRPNNTSTVLVYATGNTNPQLIGYSVFADVSLAQTVQTPLRVTSWNTPPMHHISVQLAATEPGRSMAWGISPVDQGFRYERTWGSGATATTTSTTFETDVQYPAFGDAVVSGITIGYPGARSRRIERTLATPLPAQVTEDLSTGLLPAVHSPMRDNDPQRPTLSWTVDSTAIEEDIVVGSILVRVGGSSSGWHLVAPPGTRGLRVPELPADLAASSFGPAADIAVALGESTDVPSYREARQNYNRFMLGSTISIPPLLATGNVARFSAINFGY